MSGATILRKRVKSGFVAVPNETSRDGILSFKAVGVLVHMLSLPDGAKISADVLAGAGEGKEGRSAVLSALKELRKAGYYRTVKERGPDGRLFTVVEVSDERGKLLEEHPGSPEFDYPTSAEPTSAEPTSDNPTPTDEDLLERPTHTPHSPPALTSETSPTAPPAEDGPDPFDAVFWPAYPLKTKKPDARKAFKAALTKASLEQIMAGLARWTPYWSARRNQFVPYPASWLRGEQWADDIPAHGGSRRAEAEQQTRDVGDAFVAAMRAKELTDGVT